jgi:hypothetical protein
MMDLKPVVVKEATEKRTRREGQTPFSKMVKYDDFGQYFPWEKVRGMRCAN